MGWGPLGWNKARRHIPVAKENSACSRVPYCCREDIHFWIFSLLLWGLPPVPCWPVGLSTGGTIPVASPQVQLNPFSFTVSEEHDAQGNTCQKDSMAELETEPRPSSPRTRYHSVAFPYVQDINLHGHCVYEGQAPSHGPQRQSSTCASPSLFLSFCSTQQRPKDIGTLTEYLSDRENGSKEKEKKSSLNSIMNSSTCCPKGMNSSVWCPKDELWTDQ